MHIWNPYVGKRADSPKVVLWPLHMPWVHVPPTTHSLDTQAEGLGSLWHRHFIHFVIWSNLTPWTDAMSKIIHPWSEGSDNVEKRMGKPLTWSVHYRHPISLRRSQVAAHAFNSSELEQRQVGLFKFKASLIHRESSKTARATKRTLTWNTKEKERKEKGEQNHLPSSFSSTLGPTQ